MHPNPAFRDTSHAQDLALARDRGFGVLVVADAATGALAAHIPFELAADRAERRLHLARSDFIARATVTRVGGADRLGARRPCLARPVRPARSGADLEQGRRPSARPSAPPTILGAVAASRRGIGAVRRRTSARDPVENRQDGCGRDGPDDADDPAVPAGRAVGRSDVKAEPEHDGRNTALGGCRAGRARRTGHGRTDRPPDARTGRSGRSAASTSAAVVMYSQGVSPYTLPCGSPRESASDPV